MSGLFKSKKITPEYVETPQETRVKSLWDSLQTGLSEYLGSMGKGYSGELVSPLTGMENQNLSKLSDYLDSDYASSSDLFKLAKSTTTNLLSEDPWASGGAINYTQNRLKKYLTEELLPATRQGASGTGGLYSSGAVKGEQKNVADVMDQLASYAYGYQSNLNNLKAGLIPQAASLAEDEANEPLSRIKNTMGLAGYQRTQYDQPKNVAEYEDYKNVMSRLSQYLSGSLNLAGMDTGALMYNSYKPSWFNQLIGEIFGGSSSFNFGTNSQDSSSGGSSSNVGSVVAAVA